MSSPLANFDKLSIAPKMLSSGGASSGQSAGKGKGKAPVPEYDPSTSDESSQEEEDEEEESSDDDDDDDDQEENTDMLWSDRIFAVDHCRQFGPRYAFQIAYAEVQRYSIRISPADPTRPTCSCDEEGVCHHIHWLLEQLSRATADRSQGTGLGPYEQISTTGLWTVCDRLHWELREGPEADSEETEWQLLKKKDIPHGQSMWSDPGRQTRGMIKERMKLIRDMMATLSQKVTDDYRRDIFEDPEDISIHNAFVPRDLEATLSRLLFLNDDMFHQFNSLMPNNTRASEYFRKLSVKARDTCDSLDKYCEVGPAAGQYDLISCAQILVDIVDTIHRNIAERQPLSSESREEAARALVTILRMVVKERNHDVYQNLEWTRRRPHGEPQIDRNLYLRLIGSTARANPAGGSFVLKALQDLPEAQRFVEDLEDTLAILETIGWGPAPQAYRDKLAGIITQLKDKPSPGNSTSGKRPATSMDRKAKRMK
ncbi:uncharacterized protein BP5553_07709 [Venustampulla echinocandica]|uniref:SWIM-type domain-containing protein n=1 Tax=Venustampulla echinocandica TaxID=2656787 RepID=A0A370THA4_9HELO|nr:uncharacterized protein BP5553_07709 [Venustampulla echinocandica]RDL34581.1 hypothetical protein BP5553_07709 [Venustampulla echinocandica]